MSYADLPARFHKKVLVNAVTGCHEWIGSLSTGGYGCFGVDGVTQQAHRLAYEAEQGPVPEGLVLDHLCRNRACVNPPHLEAVTQKENIARGLTGKTDRGSVKRARPVGYRTHCPQGHPYAGDNLYLTKRGGKVCKTCSRASGERHRDKKKCPWGHLLKGNFILTPRGSRKCATCAALPKKCSNGHTFTKHSRYESEPGVVACKLCDWDRQQGST